MEFIASSASNLVIVAAINKTLILSPEDAEDFTQRFQRVIEMGSLSPIAPYTVVPAAFFNQVFKDKLARILIPLNIGLVLLLLVVTSVLIPFRQTISLGYNVDGLPLPPLQSNRLLLLPIIDILFNLVDLIFGFFSFRRNETRVISYFVWAAGIITSLLLFIAVLRLFFISA